VTVDALARGVLVYQRHLGAFCGKDNFAALRRDNERSEIGCVMGKFFNSFRAALERIELSGFTGMLAQKKGSYRCRPSTLHFGWRDGFEDDTMERSTRGLGE